MKRASILVMSLVVIAGLFFAATFFMESKKKEDPYIRVSSEKLIKEYNPRLGPDTAKVKIVEFLDPECESCAAFYPSMKGILKDYDGKVQLIVRYMLFHGNSKLAALATEAAGKQGKYWEMQEMLFRRAHEWSHQSTAQIAVFEKFASELGLNIETFQKDINDQKTLDNLLADFQEGPSLGVKGTPTIFVNGRKLEQLTHLSLRELVEQELSN